MSFYLQYSWYTEFSKKFSWIKLLGLCCGGVYYLFFTLDAKCSVTVMFICLNCTITHSYTHCVVSVLASGHLAFYVQGTVYPFRSLYVLKGCMGHAHKALWIKKSRPTLYERCKWRQNGTERIKRHTGTRKKGTYSLLKQNDNTPCVSFVYKTSYSVEYTQMHQYQHQHQYKQTNYINRTRSST